MHRLLRRALLGIAFGLVLYAGAVLVVDASRLRQSLAGYHWAALLAALLLSSGNYALRFLKWELCLGWLGIREPGEGNAPGLTRRRSALIYAAGLSMSVTPGKLGEVLRSLLLRSSHGVSGSRTAPIVVADRLTDLIALVALSLLGIAWFREYLPVVAAILALVVAAVFLLGSPRWLGAALRGMGRLGLEAVAVRAERLVGSSSVLLRLRPLALLAALSVLGWGLECLGYYCVLRGFEAVEASVFLSAFLWSTTTLLGAVSFLPGGLGATEGSLAVLAARLVPGVSGPIALASTLLVRAATLWYALAIGGAALAFCLRDPALREASRRLGGDAIS
jgi:uncharacterized membrane protein YbhN (UPF0104 family)